ncbi:protein lethal(2)essential for life-like [Bombus pascuorum]|uniref:protein lethal(2)essential for life-like n=1 Tax=Bombus pascuorum TaxID=65598 RepID=UPI00298DC147|nr:protein lethal(2)essential for life-like [Bombus pascuorum]
MSLAPLLFSDWWETLDRPHRLLDQNFGLGLNPEQLTPPSRVEIYIQPRKRNAYVRRPWSESIFFNDRGISTVQAHKDKFQVMLDVQQFEPNEIDVKVVEKFVIVSAKHEEKRDDHGWVSRQFVRKYLIPEQCNIDQVISQLSTDGVLSINAPKKDQKTMENERVIKIEQTGKPAMQLKPPKRQPMKQTEEKEEH